MNTQRMQAFQAALDSLASLLPAARQNKQGYTTHRATSLSHTTGAFFKQTTWEKAPVLEVIKTGDTLPKQSESVFEQQTISMPSESVFEPQAISMPVGGYFKQVSWLTHPNQVMPISQAQASVVTEQVQTSAVTGSIVIGNSVSGFFANTAWSGAAHHPPATLRANGSQSTVPEAEPEMVEQVEDFFADIRW